MGFNHRLRHIPAFLAGLRFGFLGLVGAVLLPMVLVAQGCGYSLQTSRNELREKEGVRRVYVKPLVNNTYKPGVENLVYNALIRALLAHRRVDLVADENLADAVLQGVISTAQFGVSGSTTSDKLPPLGLNLPQQIRFPNLDRITVATVYSAVLGCEFNLIRRNPPPNQKAILWSAGFSRAKPFPASNQLDVPGTTSALINESEFERALADIATSMMDDVHESMLAMF